MVKVTALKINTTHLKIIVLLFIGFYFATIFLGSKLFITGIVHNLSSDFFISCFENTLSINKTNNQSINLTKVNAYVNDGIKQLLGFDIKEPKSIMSTQIKLLKNNGNIEYMMIAESPLISDENNEEYSDSIAQSIMDETPEIKPIKNIINNKGIKIINETKYKIDIKSYIEKPLKLSISKKKPQVLIYHTHSCESYAPSEKYNYIPSDNDRTTDLKYTVVEVGTQLAKILEKKYNIKVIHDKTVHDRDAYNRAYAKSANTVQKYLDKYSDFNLIIDLHRDALNVNGAKLRTVTSIDGKDSARVMTIIGTDSRGLPHPNWKENLNMGIKFMKKMNDLYPGLGRGINLKLGRFNQYLSQNSILLEVGANGNTLNEALNSTAQIAYVISEILK